MALFMLELGIAVGMLQRQSWYHPQESKVWSESTVVRCMPYIQSTHPLSQQCEVPPALSACQAVGCQAAFTLQQVMVKVMKPKIDYSLPFNLEDESMARYMWHVCQSPSTTLSTPGLLYMDGLKPELSSYP